MYGPLLSGVFPVMRSNFSLMLLSSAIPSLIRQSTMARNIKNNAIPIAAMTTARRACERLSGRVLWPHLTAYSERPRMPMRVSLKFCNEPAPKLTIPESPQAKR
jgi:hypothetical protein